MRPLPLGMHHGMQKLVSQVTQANTWDELPRNAREAAAAYFFENALPRHIRPHLVHDEVLAT
jgi:hypothetical protein